MSVEYALLHLSSISFTASSSERRATIVSAASFVSTPIFVTYSHPLGCLICAHASGYIVRNLSTMSALIGFSSFALMVASVLRVLLFSKLVELGQAVVNPILHKITHRAPDEK